jgi:hypothetical protein
MPGKIPDNRKNIFFLQTLHFSFCMQREDPALSSMVVIPAGMRALVLLKSCHVSHVIKPLENQNLFFVMVPIFSLDIKKSAGSLPRSGPLKTKRQQR